jgi:uncharacterized DUF497 family protein
MPELLWNPIKNQSLLRERGLSFEMVAAAYVNGELVIDMDHPNADRANQRMLLVKIDGYVCAVPYVQDGSVKFLKTMYYSRKYDALYGDGHGQKGER